MKIYFIIWTKLQNNKNFEIFAIQICLIFFFFTNFPFIFSSNNENKVSSYVLYKLIKDK